MAGAPRSPLFETGPGESVAVMMFALSLAAPIGVLLWGFVIGRVSVEAAILFGAVGTVVSGVALLRPPKAPAGR